MPRPPGLRLSDQWFKPAKKVCEDQGLSHERLAEKIADRYECGFTRQLVGKFFKGIPIDRRNFAWICEELGLNVSEVVASSDEPISETNDEAIMMTDALMSQQQEATQRVNLVSQYQPNPFGHTGRITNPADFFNREELMSELFEELARGCSRSIIGERQIGKSSILSMVCAWGPERLNLPPDAFVYLDMQKIRDEDEFFLALCRKIGIEPCRGSDLDFALEGKRYIICIDEIEKMARPERFSGEEREELRGFADGADAPFTLVIASRLRLDHLFPDSEGMTSPLHNICPPIDVKPFSPDTARKFLIQKLEGTGISFTESEIEQLIKESGGHPAKLQLSAAQLFKLHRERTV